MFKKAFLTSIVCGLITILTQPMSVAAASPIPGQDPGRLL